MIFSRANELVIWLNQRANRTTSFESDLFSLSAQEIESLTAENERLRKALEMAGKRLYKEGAPHSYVDDVEAVLDGKEVEYYD